MKSAQREQIEIVLRQFLDGQTSVLDIRSALQDFLAVHFTDAPALRGVWKTGPVSLEDLIEAKILVAPRHVLKMLGQYQSCNITGRELSDWAAVIIMTQAFEPAGVKEDREEAFDGLLWTILNELVVPEIHGGLNTAAAQEYVNRLRTEA